MEEVILVLHVQRMISEDPQERMEDLKINSIVEILVMLPTVDLIMIVRTAAEAALRIVVEVSTTKLNLEVILGDIAITTMLIEMIQDYQMLHLFHYLEIIFLLKMILGIWGLLGVGEYPDLLLRESLHLVLQIKGPLLCILDIIPDQEA